MICILDDRGHYLPTRARLAEALGTSADSIDSAIKTACLWREITEVNVIEKAGRRRYMKPGAELRQVFESA